MKIKNKRSETKLNENEIIKSYLWRQESDDGGHVGDKTEESKAEYHIHKGRVRYQNGCIFRKLYVADFGIIEFWSHFKVIGMLFQQ